MEGSVTGCVWFQEGGTERPAVGVLVSTDRAVCVTNERGEYKLPVTPDDCFVKVTTPRGYRAAGPWYFPMDPTADSRGGDGSRSFRLVPDPARDQDEFSFIQITDLHVGYAGFLGSEEPLKADLQAILGWSPGPDFFAVTGDLSDHGQEAELLACRRVLDALPVPAFPLPGNHDYFETNSPEAYRRVFGPTSYSFDWGPVHFVAYDAISDRPDAAGRAWLARDLAAQPPGKPVILLLHDQLAADFFDLWREHAIVASISGHWHSSRVFHDGRVTHFNGPSLSFGGKDYSPRGFRVFRWRNRTLTAETIALATGDEGASVWPWPRSGLRTRRELRLDREEGKALPHLWRRRLPGEVHMASPIALGGRLYAACTSEDGPGRAQVVALELTDGETLWQRPVGDSVKNRLSAGGDLLYGVTVTGEVFALSPQTGEEVWRRGLNDPSRRWVYSTPLYHDGRLYVGSAGHFLCLEASSGSVLWERTDLGRSDWISSYGAPSIAWPVVLVGFVWQPFVLYGLDAATGETLWAHPRQRGSCTSTPVVADGAAYVLRHPGVLQKLVPATGERVWERSGLARWSPGAPAVAGGRVFVASGDGRVLCYDAASGEPIWSYLRPRVGGPWPDPLPYGRGSQAILGSPVPTGSTLWAACGDGTLLSLQTEDGACTLRHRVGAPIYTTPLPIPGGLIVIDAGGVVHAFCTPEDAGGAVPDAC